MEPWELPDLTQSTRHGEQANRPPFASLLDISRSRVLRQQGVMETLYAADLTQVTYVGHCYDPVYQPEAAWGHGSFLSTLAGGRNYQMVHTLKCHCKPEQTPFELLGNIPDNGSRAFQPDSNLYALVSTI